MILKDKVVAISGAAGERGIGLATARLMAGLGAHVAILDLDADASRRAAESLEGDGHLGISCDVTNRAACMAAI